MTDIKKTSPTPNAAPMGGLHLAWLLADDPRTIKTRDGNERTVIELRDPRRLSQSLVLWLDGPVGSFDGAQPGLTISLHVESVRPGRARGELVGQVGRATVEAAFDRARRALA